MSDKVVTLKPPVRKSFGETAGMTLMERADWIADAIGTRKNPDARVRRDVRARAMTALLEHEQSVLPQVPIEGQIT